MRINEEITHISITMPSLTNEIILLSELCQGNLRETRLEAFKSGSFGSLTARTPPTKPDRNKELPRATPTGSFSPPPPYL
jgi:hypothetical protein